MYECTHHSSPLPEGFLQYCYCFDCEKNNFFDDEKKVWFCKSCGKLFPLYLRNIRELEVGELCHVHECSSSDVVKTNDTLLCVDENMYLINNKDIIKGEHDIYVHTVTDHEPEEIMKSTTTYYEILEGERGEKGRYMGTCFRYSDTLHNHKGCHYDDVTVKITAPKNLKEDEVGYLHMNTGGGWMCGDIPITAPVRFMEGKTYLGGNIFEPGMSYSSNEDATNNWRVCRFAEDCRNKNSVESNEL